MILPLPLNLSSIMQALTANCRQYLAKVSLVDITTSTNDYLITALKQYQAPHPSGWLCLAEQQSQGRGRDGKSWFSPPGNIYLSLSWCYPKTMLKISALSLVVAASLLAVLTEIIPEKHLACKWPNDILINQRKLAGILIENIATALEHRLVIGVGINMHLSAKQQQHWACLEKFTSIDRNTLIGQFLSVLIENLISFPKNGFQPFCAMINNYDILVGRQINIITPTTIFTGTATGIDDNGELLVVDQHGQQQRFSYGEASPRFVIN